MSDWNDQLGDAQFGAWCELCEDNTGVITDDVTGRGLAILGVSRRFRCQRCGHIVTMELTAVHNVCGPKRFE
jgi:hypothetical protein